MQSLSYPPYSILISKLLKPTDKTVGLFLCYYELLVTIHLMRQAVSERLRENDKRRRPVITAPTMLVATNSIAKSITENSTVASIAKRSTVRIVFMQQG